MNSKLYLIFFHVTLNIYNVLLEVVFLDLLEDDYLVFQVMHKDQKVLCSKRT